MEFMQPKEIAIKLKSTTQDSSNVKNAFSLKKFTKEVIAQETFQRKTYAVLEHSRQGKYQAFAGANTKDRGLVRQS